MSKNNWNRWGAEDERGDAERHGPTAAEHRHQAKHEVVQRGVGIAVHHVGDEGADRRLAAKERVIGIVAGAAGGFAIAYLAGTPRLTGQGERFWQIAGWAAIALTAVAFGFMFRSMTGTNSL